MSSVIDPPPIQGGPPRRLSVPVLALAAQTSYWTSSRPLCRGTGPTMVLVARGANGSSRQIGPTPAYNAGWLRTPEMVQGVRGGAPRRGAGMTFAVHEPAPWLA